MNSKIDVTQTKDMLLSVTMTEVLTNMHKAYGHLHVPFVKDILVALGFANSSSSEQERILCQIINEYNTLFPKLEEVKPSSQKFTIFRSCWVFNFEDLFILQFSEEEIMEFQTLKGLENFIKTEHLHPLWVGTDEPPAIEGIYFQDEDDNNQGFARCTIDSSGRITAGTGIVSGTTCSTGAYFTISSGSNAVTWTQNILRDFLNLPCGDSCEIAK